MFGTRDSLYVSIAIYTASSLFFLYGQSVITLSAGAFLAGCYDQVITILMKVVMSEVFGSDFTYFLPICYSGFAFSDLLWPNIVSWIVNPTNEPPTIAYKEKGSSVYYFGPNIISNYYEFIKIQLALHVIILSFLGLFVGGKKMKRSKFFDFLASICTGRFWETSFSIKYRKMKAENQADFVSKASMGAVSKRTFGQSVHGPSLKSKSVHAKEGSTKQQHDFEMNPLVLDEKASTKINADEQQGMFENMLGVPLITKTTSFTVHNEDGEKIHKLDHELSVSERAKQIDTNSAHADLLPQPLEEEPPLKRKKTVEQKSVILDFHNSKKQRTSKEVWANLLSANFIYIFLLCTIHTTTHGYYFSDFKIIGLHFFNNDTLINLIGSLAFIPNIAMNYLFGFAYDYLGMRGCYEYTSHIFLGINLLYGLFPHSLTNFCFFSGMQRVG